MESLRPRLHRNLPKRTPAGAHRRLFAQVFSVTRFSCVPELPELSAIFGFGNCCVRKTRLILQPRTGAGSQNAISVGHFYAIRPSLERGAGAPVKVSAIH